MDKETLSNYGWIVICVLVLAVMLALATPFGNFIAEGFKATFLGFGQTNNSMLDTMYDSTGTPPSLEYLQSKYQFEYYSTFSGAVNDVNNGTIGTNADMDKIDAVAGIYTDNEGNPVVVLLKDTTETKRITLLADMGINLGGHLLTFTNDYFGFLGSSGNTVRIDGRLNGSGIALYGVDGGGITISPKQTKLIIDGGSISIFESCRHEDYAAYALGCGTGTTVEVKNCVLTAVGTNNAQVGCVTMKGQMNMSNCTLTSTTDTGANYGIMIHETGNLVANGCEITTTSATYNNCIRNGGIATITNCSMESKTTSPSGSPYCIYTLSTGTTTHNSCKFISGVPEYNV